MYNQHLTRGGKYPNGPLNNIYYTLLTPPATDNLLHLPLPSQRDSSLSLNKAVVGVMNSRNTSSGPVIALPSPGSRLKMYKSEAGGIGTVNRVIGRGKVGP
jgi:hypothetical protein